MRLVQNLLLVMVLLVYSNASAQDTTEIVSDSPRRSIPLNSLRSIPQSAFTVGEHLIFDVGFSFITAGEASFEIFGADSIHGRECYRVVFTVKSVPSFSWIYKVEDRYETVLDAKGIFPWKFIQHVREGGYRHDFTAEFDQLHGLANANNKSYPIPPYVHDVVSAFYYVRTMDFSKSRVGQKYLLRNFFKDTTYRLAVKFLGRQQLSVDAGLFNTIIVEPLIQEGGLFKSNGRVILWLTDDERRIPVKVSTKVVVGSIDAELREYHGVILPINAKVK
jgi:Protein of unknown function (DUF3108).